ncbi:heme oxygenase [Aeromicrobium marinum DSM 15272]|uniref:Heme oxygenase n=1 Tax=Aeromicrobium marinum DSM 15272 TaxID=585531 RepID=E2SBN6_9ACTN|nr:biliverdin-producing heme oxygenase [Aeromicrobium marinum]EFQ83782.1 heme oxygenase [Aeromicrobium marinum DSM 15272]
MTVTASTSTAPVPLSTLLREGSAAEHRETEGSSFMTELLAGRVGAAGYLTYLVRLRRVYVALEEMARVLADDPVAAAVIDPRLERLAGIDADVAFWSERTGEVADDTSGAVDRYVGRIAAATDDPSVFVAHHYTRYLGDLSGGQVIGRLLERTFDLGGRGISFYAFPEIPKPKPYKDTYRATLDALPLGPADRDRMLEEVKAVFGCNGEVFDELTAELPRWAV